MLQLHHGVIPLDIPDSGDLGSAKLLSEHFDLQACLLHLPTDSRGSYLQGCHSFPLALTLLENFSPEGAKLKDLKALEPPTPPF